MDSIRILCALIADLAEAPCVVLQLGKESYFIRTGHGERTRDFSALKKIPVSNLTGQVVGEFEILGRPGQELGPQATPERLHAIAAQASALYEAWPVRQERRDALRHKLLVATMREFEDLSASTFELANIGIVHTETDGKFLRANRGFCQMTGYHLDELLSMNFADLASDFDRDHDRRLARSMLKGEANGYDVERRCVCKGDKAIWVRVSMRLARNGSGDPLYFVAVVTDVTEKREAEQKLSEQRARMMTASKMSALGEMASGIAHEINNPLAIIHARAAQLRELMSMGSLEPETFSRSLDRIEITAMRISKIVSSLRRFGRDVAHDEFQAESLSTIIDDTLEICRERFRAGGVEIRLNDVSPALRVECLPVQISQVLLNLLNNAYDAIEENDQRWVDISVADLDSYVRLTVTDSGSGIPDDLREKILQPFFTTKPPGKGTGLGLSISKGIIESHHGSFRVDSAGPHTRFVIELPKRQSLRESFQRPANQS